MKISTMIIIAIFAIALVVIVVILMNRKSTVLGGGDSAEREQSLLERLLGEAGVDEGATGTINSILGAITTKT